MYVYFCCYGEQPMDTFDHGFVDSRAIRGTYLGPVWKLLPISI